MSCLSEEVGQLPPIAGLKFYIILGKYKELPARCCAWIVIRRHRYFILLTITTLDIRMGPLDSKRASSSNTP